MHDTQAAKWNAFLLNLAGQVAHLYPKRQLSADKQTWDVGHKCLAYFDKVLPLDQLLLPSYLLLLYDRVGKDLSKIPDVSKQAFTQALLLGFEQLKLVRPLGGAKTTVDLLQQHRAANCAELAGLAYQWMKKQGVNAHLVTAECYHKNNCANTGHEFVLYHKNPDSKMSFEQMARELDNPDICICDLWTGQVGQAQHLLDGYTRLFVPQNEERDYKTLNGFYMVLINELSAGDDLVIGRIRQNGESRENNLHLFKKPVWFSKYAEKYFMPEINGMLNEGR